jgi:hypothetical protein
LPRHVRGDAACAAVHARVAAACLSHQCTPSLAARDTLATSTRERFAACRTGMPNSQRFRIARRSFLSRTCIAARFLSHWKFDHSSRSRRKQHFPAP